MARIAFVTRLRASDMPIGTISRYLDLVEQGDHTAPQRLALMEEHRAGIRRRMGELQAALAVTEYKITVYGGNAAP
jgi:DNA-binding transcriptional MerR regulator